MDEKSNYCGHKSITVKINKLTQQAVILCQACKQILAFDDISSNPDVIKGLNSMISQHKED